MSSARLCPISLCIATLAVVHAQGCDRRSAPGSDEKLPVLAVPTQSTQACWPTGDMGLVVELPPSGLDRRTDGVGGLSRIEHEFREQIQELKSIATSGRGVEPQCIVDDPRVVAAAHAEFAGGYAYVKRPPILPVLRTTVPVSIGTASFHVIDAQFDDESVLHIGEYKARFESRSGQHEILLWLHYPQWNGSVRGVAGSLESMLLSESADGALVAPADGDEEKLIASVGGMVQIEHTYAEQISALRSMASKGEGPEDALGLPQLIYASYSSGPMREVEVKSPTPFPETYTVPLAASGGDQLHVATLVFKDGSELLVAEYKSRYVSGGVERAIAFWLFYPSWNPESVGLARELATKVAARLLAD